MRSASIALGTRLLSSTMATLLFAFLFYHYLHFFWQWPELLQGLSTASRQTLLMAITLLTALACLWLYNIHHRHNPLEQSALIYQDLALFIARAAFWSALFIGITDAVISMLRVEGYLEHIIGKDVSTQMARSSFRGLWIHIPLMGLGILVAAFNKSPSFIWLTLLIVICEFFIVISNFVFSYEQVYMADLVRFWYAGIFLFGSGYTLMHEGHVRVDVIYARLSPDKKAWCNIIGILFLALPLCWIILFMGLQNKGASIAAPLLNFEVSQSGYGMYVKYLMAGYLLIFATTVALQCISLLLTSVGQLTDNKADHNAV